MSGLYSNEKNLIGLVEAYNSIYDDCQEVDSDTLQIIEDFSYLFFSNGCDVDDLSLYFSETTLEQNVNDYINIIENNALYESSLINEEYIEEQFYILNERIGGLRGLKLQLPKLSLPSTVKPAARPTARSARPTAPAQHRPGQASRPARPTSAPVAPRPGQASSTGPRAARPTSAPVAPRPGTPTQKPATPLNKSMGVAKNVLKGVGNVAVPVLTAIPGVESERKKGSGWARSLAKGATVAAGSHFGGKLGSKLGMGTGPAAVITSGLGALAGSVAGAELSGRAFDKLAGPNAKQRAAIAAQNKGDTTKAIQDVRNRGGKLAFQAGGGAAAMRSGASAADVQRRGMSALRSREQSPNTAAGFDDAFASARRLGQKNFKWRGGEYTTQVAHTDLLDLVRGYLINEGYANDLTSANKILNNMSESWFQNIIELQIKN